MPQYHKRTLALLGNEGMRQERSIEGLANWAEERAVTLPEAFKEWARLDDGTLLRKYSNDDWFWFDRPELVITPDGFRGIRFNSENQHNFDRIVALDMGDDPPVLFAWLGQPPWVVNAERFSDAVFAQVFDWQYQLEFSPQDPAYKEIAPTGEISLKTDRCLPILRARYDEDVTTRFIVEGDRFTEYRFVVSPSLRLRVSISDDRSAEIQITGRPSESVQLLEEELKLLIV